MYGCLANRGIDPRETEQGWMMLAMEQVVDRGKLEANCSPCVAAAYLSSS